MDLEKKKAAAQAALAAFPGYELCVLLGLDPDIRDFRDFY